MFLENEDIFEKIAKYLPHKSMFSLRMTSSQLNIIVKFNPDFTLKNSVLKNHLTYSVHTHKFLSYEQFFESEKRLITLNKSTLQWT